MSLSVMWSGSAQKTPRREPPLDLLLLTAVALVLGLGIVMVGSASVTIADRQLGTPFHFLVRQTLFLAVGVALGWIAFQLPLKAWERLGPAVLIAGLVLLLIVLVPGLGRTVNGSTRWLSLGPVNLQISEFMKLAVIVYLAGYLVRRHDEVVHSIAGFLKPMAGLGVVTLLLLAEPDFGATVVITATAMGMLFLAGVRWQLFAALALAALGLFVLLAVSSPYRLERLTAFLNPWADPFNSGFQLTQALIAFGRGEWLGVGLGASIQKLFYLPEAHTDFLYAVLAEELGFVGAASVLVLFAFIVWRAFAIARVAGGVGLPFGLHLAHGIGLWLGLQSCINIGVNMGVLPTKGLTLPLMSYGGSSMIATCVAVALLLRVDREARLELGIGRRPAGGAP